MREVEAYEWLDSDIITNTIAYGGIEAVSKVVELGIASGEKPLVVIFASEEESEGFASFEGLHTAPISDEFGKSVA